MRPTNRTIMVFGLCAALPALANVPVNDAALLTKQSQTAAIKVKLVPIKTQRKNASNGVRCAVTTGKRANVSNPTVQPQAGDGARKVQSYSPENSVTPDGRAQGARLSNQTLFQSAGKVVGGLDASRSTLQAARSGFRTAGQQAGTGETVMAALDINSAARIRNNLAWNEAINATNLWVMALNALNLARNGDVSRAAGGMRASGATPRDRVCPTGTTGSGTALDPCRTTASCRLGGTEPSGDPACVTPRYRDTAGNVLFFLEQIQSPAAAASNQ